MLHSGLGPLSVVTVPLHSSVKMWDREPLKP